jgi:phosphatidylserine decarboxylase
MNIHREGRRLLFYLLVILFLINAVIYYLELPELILNLSIAASLIIYILVLQFFRNPSVVTPQTENQIYSPADGKVVVIEKTHESEFLKEERIQVSVFMSPLNVHVNRAPLGGVINFFKYHPGKYLNGY